MRIAVDLDGTICEVKKPGERYEDVKPIPGAIETLQEFKKKGIEIIIYTARHMVTCNNDIAKITAIQAPIIIEWCKKYNCPYDGLLFGKPYVDFFIDDRAIEFNN